MLTRSIVVNVSRYMSIVFHLQTFTSTQYRATLNTPVVKSRLGNLPTEFMISRHFADLRMCLTSHLFTHSCQEVKKNGENFKWEKYTLECEVLSFILCSKYSKFQMPLLIYYTPAELKECHLHRSTVAYLLSNFTSGHCVNHQGVRGPETKV